MPKKEIKMLLKRLRDSSGELIVMLIPQSEMKKDRTDARGFGVQDLKKKDFNMCLWLLNKYKRRVVFTADNRDTMKVIVKHKAKPA